MVSKDIVKKLTITPEEFERNAVPDEIMINLPKILARQVREHPET